MLRSLFAKNNINNNNNIFNRIIANSIYQFYRNGAVVVKHNINITSNISIFSNNFSTFLGKYNNVTLTNFKYNNVTLTNFKSYSTSEIDIKSEIEHVKAQIDNVTNDIKTIESQ
jgi:hypothetical protein